MVHVSNLNLADIIASVAKSAGKQPLATTQEAEENIRIKLKAEELSLAQDNRKLRKLIAALVGVGLAVEIVLLFYLVTAQGLHRLPFKNSAFGLEQWTFSVFTSAVLLQTFGLATLIVRNLFPNSETKKAA